jgi:hypothetical protein
MPHRLAWQVGAEQWLTAFARPVGLSAELTKVFRYTYATFYERDYVHSDRPLGYDLGPDVENLDVELRLEAAVDWSARIGLQLARRGASGLGDAWQPDEPASPWDASLLTKPIETETAVRVGAELRPWPYAWADVVAGYHHRSNARNVAGETTDTFEVRMALSIRK